MLKRILRQALGIRHSEMKVLPRCLLWALYQIRLKQLERQFNVTMRTRVDERSRIARAA
jgi:hypothetical protein